MNIGQLVYLYAVIVRLGKAARFVSSPEASCYCVYTPFKSFLMCSCSWKSTGVVSVGLSLYHGMCLC